MVINENPVLLVMPDGSMRQTNEITDDDWDRVNEGQVKLVFLTEVAGGGGFAEYVPKGRNGMPNWRMIPGRTKDGKDVPEV